MTERERIEQLERENEELRKEIERLRRQLEEALRKIRRQAAPFSRNRPKEHPAQPGRKPGARYGERSGRPIPSVIEEEWVAELPERCTHCGGQIVQDAVAQQYQEDIVRQKVVRRFAVEIGHCRRCGRRAQGRHRLQTSEALGAAAVQIGPEALVLAAHLSPVMGQSHAKIAQLLQLGYGLTVHRSTLCRALTRMGRKARPTYQALRLCVRNSPVAWMDETGWRVAAVLAWLWVVCTQQLSVYVIQRGRGFAEAAAILGEDFAGILHHDGLALYYGFGQAQHQSCLAHLVRRCRAMIETAGSAAPHCFAARVRELLCQAIAVRQRYEHGEISLHGMRVAAGRLANGKLDQLLLEDQRSADNRRLSNHLAHESPHLLTFVRQPAAESTNNRAERELRPAVVARKTWGGNRTDTGARTFESLASVLRTAHLQDQDSFDLLLPLLRSRTPFVLDLIPDSS